MKRKIPTRPSLLRRIVRNEIGFMAAMLLLCLLALVALCGAADGILALIGAGYDPRIGVPA